MSAVPADSSATGSTMLAVESEAFWRELNPDLHITRFPLAGMDHQIIPGTFKTELYSSAMIREGYFQAPPIIDHARATRLSQVISQLVERQIPPVFAFVYDEFWHMFSGLDPLLRDLLGENYKMMQTDIWGWKINMGDSEAGWGPHRDLPVKEAVRESDGRPRLINVWMPLTNTTPLNACMYVYPKHLDPNFPHEIDGINFKMKDWQNIRALPAEPGAALGWDTQVLHWGGRSTTFAEEPRISIGIYFFAEEIDLHTLDPDVARENLAPLTFNASMPLDFANRLRAIAGAIFLYNKRIPKDFPHNWEDIFNFARKYRVKPLESQ